MAWSDEARARSIQVRRQKAALKGITRALRKKDLADYQRRLTATPVKTIMTGRAGGSGGVYNSGTARQTPRRPAGPNDYGKKFKNAKAARRWANKQIKRGIRKAKKEAPKEKVGRIWQGELDERFTARYRKMKSKRGFRTHMARVRMRTIKTKAENKMPRSYWRAKQKAYVYKNTRKYKKRKR